MPHRRGGMSVCMYLCVCIYVCMYVYIYIYTYICIHIHIHARTIPLPATGSTLCLIRAARVFRRIPYQVHQSHMGGAALLTTSRNRKWYHKHQQPESDQTTELQTTRNFTHPQALRPKFWQRRIDKPRITRRITAPACRTRS